MNKLVEFWSEFTPCAGNNIHPQDEDFFKKKLKDENISLFEFSDSKEYKEELPTTIRLGLLPRPYMGDIENSKVIIVLLNPGFAGTEYSETNDISCSEAIMKTIRQDFSGALSESRYMCMNPHFKDTAGYKYLCNERKKGQTKGRLWDCIELFSEEHDISIDETIKFMSNNICLIEVFPYHSNKFKDNGIQLKELPSLIAINEFLDEKVNDTSNKIFIARGKKYLNVANPIHSNVTIFDNRSVFFTKARHGKTLFEYLNYLYIQQH